MISKDEVAKGCGDENWEHFEEEYAKAYGEPLQPKLPPKVEEFLRELLREEFSICSDEAYIYVDTIDRGEVILNKKKLQKHYEEMIK